MNSYLGGQAKLGKLPQLSVLDSLSTQFVDRRQAWVNPRDKAMRRPGTAQASVTDLCPRNRDIAMRSIAL